MDPCWVHGSCMASSVCRDSCWRTYCQINWDQGHPASVLSQLVIFADSICKLLHPHIANPVINNGLYTKILVCLATQYNKSVSAVRQHVSVNEIELLGMVQIVGGGDTMVASSLVKHSQEDSRNATYVRVSIIFFSSFWRLLLIIHSTNLVWITCRQEHLISELSTGVYTGDILWSAATYFPSQNASCKC